MKKYRMFEPPDTSTDLAIPKTKQKLCPNCYLELRRLKHLEHWDENIPKLLHRYVICDELRGGCGWSGKYTKLYIEPKLNISHRDEYEGVGKRRGRVDASTKGVFEVTPCTCKDAKEPPDPNYLDSHKIIEKCADCGNYKEMEIPA